MNGNFARWILCSGTTSVDFGLYSSMFGTWLEGFCWDCAAKGCVLAARGHIRAREAMHASVAAETEMARQDFIARSSGETRLVSHRAPNGTNVWAANETPEWAELQILTRHHSSLQGRRDIWRAGPSGCTMKLSEKFEPMPFAGSYKPGSTEKAMPGSSMV